MKILLIEDHDACAVGFMVLMEEYLPEAEVVCTDTLYQACRWVESKEFDVIVLDLSLPDAKETQGVRALMQVMRQQGRIVPIVVYTAYEQYRADCMDEGVGVFLVKANIDGEDLAEVLRRVVTGGE